MVTGAPNTSLIYNAQNYDLGYHVFDDCLWFTDIPDNQITGASGLAILSPFTGHPLWVRYADLTKSSGSGLFGGLSTSEQNDWGQMAGLHKVGGSIYRAQNVGVQGSTSTTHRYLIMRYNSLLEFQEQIETPDDFFQFSGNDRVSDIWYSPTEATWFIMTEGNGPAFVAYNGSDFSSFRVQGNLFVIGAEDLTVSTLIDEGSFGHAEINGVKRIVNVGQQGHNTAIGSFSAKGSGIWEFNITNEGSFPSAPYSGI